MKFEIKAKLRGRYKLLVSKVGKRPHKETEWFDNIITDQGKDLIGSPGYVDGFQIPYINPAVAVGTGSGTPTVADTTLDAQGAYYNGLAGVPTSNSYVAGPPTYWKTVYTYDFPEGGATGTWSEVGVGYYDSGSGNVKVFSRQLILDGGGSPTTITILSDEILTVIYELRAYFDTTDNAYAFVINGTDNYSGVYRPANISTATSLDHGAGHSASLVTHSGSIGAITSSPGGASANPSPFTVTPYTGGNYYLEWTATYPYNVSNFSINSLLFITGVGSWQFSVTPAIVKTDSYKLTLVVRISWDRYTP